MLSTEAINYQQLSDDYSRIEQALNYLEAHYQEQPSLNDVAASIGLSEYHFQRLFTRWVGISPKRFLQFVTKERAKELLDGSASLLEVAYQTGLSGPSRLHDLFVSCEAVTPGEYKLHGEGLTIQYGFHPSPFGRVLLAMTERGVCGLAFAGASGEEDALDDLYRRWRKARLLEDRTATAPLVEQIFPLSEFIGGESQPRETASDRSVHLFLNGTNFQIKVWEALLRVPPGALTTYQDIANRIGMPKAARAVGQAVGANPVAFIIPCHRVIRKLGVLGGYRWGVARKQAILSWEMARQEEMAQ